MICGLATNGYYYGWSIPQMLKNKHLVIDKSKKDAKTNWEVDDVDVKSKRMRNFWLTRELLHNHYMVNPNAYTQYFTWTNLMKIAPFVGGNPTESEFQYQVDICKKILKYEIDTLKPKNLIIMSGAITNYNNWAYDFIEELGLSPEYKISKNLITGVYDYKKSRIITTIRPEALPKGSSKEDLLNSIIANLK
jgi:hypothetical protein